MKFLKKEKSVCPYCNEPLQWHELHVITHNDNSKWYKPTPNPDFACPKCNGLVKRSLDNPMFFIIATFWGISWQWVDSFSKKFDNPYFEMIGIVYFGLFVFGVYKIISDDKLIKK